MGDSTRSEVDSVVRLNRLQELYEENKKKSKRRKRDKKKSKKLDFVESVRRAMKKVLCDNPKKKRVHITFGPNEMHEDFANKDIQWPFAVFVIDFAGKCKVQKVKTAFEKVVKAHIKSQGYGEESGLMVCCDRAKSSHSRYTFYVLDRILLKESLEGIVKSYAQDGERDDLLEAIIKCHRETPESLTLDDNTRNNVIVQIVSFAEWSGHIHDILESSDLKKKNKKLIIPWPASIREAVRYVLDGKQAKTKDLTAIRESQKQLLDYKPGQPCASSPVDQDFLEQWLLGQPFEDDDGCLFEPIVESDTPMLWDAYVSISDQQASQITNQGQSRENGSAN